MSFSVTWFNPESRTACILSCLEYPLPPLSLDCSSSEVVCTEYLPCNIIDSIWSGVCWSCEFRIGRHIWITDTMGYSFQQSRKSYDLSFSTPKRHSWLVYIAALHDCKYLMLDDIDLSWAPWLRLWSTDKSYQVGANNSSAIYSVEIM